MSAAARHLLVPQLVCLGYCGLVPGASCAPIVLTSPRGGEEWSAGSLHLVTWQSSAEVTSVALELSTDSGATWTPLLGATDAHPAISVPSTPDTSNRFLGRVPEQLSPHCRVRITNTGEPTMTAQSQSDFTLTPSQEVPEYHWTCITGNAAFAGRDGAGALVFNGKMWLLGGWNPGDKLHFPKICNSEVWSSTDGLTWTLENPQAPWEGRHTAGYVLHRGKMWIVGGDCNQGHYQKDVWSSADGVNWTCVNDSVPWAPRVLHYTVAFRDKIWGIAGQTIPRFGGGEEVFYDDVWCTEDGAKWTRVAEHSPWPQRAMIGHSAVFNERLWLLGGGTYDTVQRPRRLFYNDVWSTADGINWECHAEAAPWAPRQYHDVAVWDNKLWVMEGWNQENRNDVWCSSDGANWYEVPNTPWAPRHAASPFVYDGALWMVAGNNMFPDVWKLTK